MRRSKTAFLRGVKDLRLEYVDLPDPSPGELIARIGAATTCGTDVKILNRGYVGDIVTYPMPFGHEWGGTVVQLGERVNRFGIGERIRAGNTAPCYECVMCMEGKHNLCLARTWLWGAFAEYISVPAQIVANNSQHVPNHVGFAEAAIAEPLGCVIHGSDRIGIGPQDTVAILGSGAVGLLHLLVALQKEAKKIIMTDLVDQRLDHAIRLGADDVVNSSREDAVSVARELTGGFGADVVIESVGLTQTWDDALRLVKPGGRVLEFGGCPSGTSIQVDTELLHYGEVTVMGSFHASPHEFEKALNLIAERTIDVRPLITRQMPLDRVSEAFERLSTSKEEIKIAVIP